jgi:hypothetical protein
MKTFLARRLFLQLCTVAGASTVAGCGTVLHPERRGQPAGRLDWGVVVLDAVGLLFFFIPGIIAFAVDFSTGAIYLPPEYSPEGAPLALGPLEKIETSPEPSVAEVEAIVSERAGRPVKLQPGAFVSEPLGDLGDFWTVQKRARGQAKAA